MQLALVEKEKKSEAPLVAEKEREGEKSLTELKEENAKLRLVLVKLEEYYREKEESSEKMKRRYFGQVEAG